MSVDFFDCRVCGESVCECGDFESCSCRNKWCSMECALKDGFIPEYDEEECDDNYARTCNFCRNEDHEDITLLNYALSLLDKSREELIKMYNESE